MQYWQLFIHHFREIISKTEHKTILSEIIETPNNILLYSIYGFPIDIFLDEILKSRLNIKTLYKNQAIWNKNIPYIENQYFFEIDLMNPDIPKNFEFLTQFILHIVKTRALSEEKQIIVLKHIELLCDLFFDFRILLEKYAKNVMFICTTHHISKIEAPIRSRFNIFRIPLFSSSEIDYIFQNYLSIENPLQICHKDNRNIIKAIFIADTKMQIEYNFPPLYDFIKNIDLKQNNLETVRTLAYKCCQYNIGICNLVKDFISIIENTDFVRKKIRKNISLKKYMQIKTEYKYKIVSLGADIDHQLNLTNKGREPIYIEAFLCQVIFSNL